MRSTSSLTLCLKYTIVVNESFFSIWYTPQCLKITQNVSFEFFSSGRFFGIFNELLSTQNVNVARFARKVLKMRLF